MCALMQSQVPVASRKEPLKCGEIHLCDLAHKQLPDESWALSTICSWSSIAKSVNCCNLRYKAQSESLSGGVSFDFQRHGAWGRPVDLGGVRLPQACSSSACARLECAARKQDTALKGGALCQGLLETDAVLHRQPVPEPFASTLL